MEGNVMMPRSISEPITLRNNVFVDINKKKEEVDENVEDGLQPGEIIDIPDDKMMGQQDAQELMKILK